MSEIVISVLIPLVSALAGGLAGAYCQRRFNFDPPGREIAEVKLTHRVLSVQGEREGEGPPR
jgi:hypothetical protein